MGPRKPAVPKAIREEKRELSSSTLFVETSCSISARVVRFCTFTHYISLGVYDRGIEKANSTVRVGVNQRNVACRGCG